MGIRCLRKKKKRFEKYELLNMRINIRRFVKNDRCKERQTKRNINLRLECKWKLIIRVEIFEEMRKLWLSIINIGIFHNLIYFKNEYWHFLKWKIGISMLLECEKIKEIEVPRRIRKNNVLLHRLLRLATWSMAKVKTLWTKKATSLLRWLFWFIAH